MKAYKFAEYPSHSVPVFDPLGLSLSLSLSLPHMVREPGSKKAMYKTFAVTPTSSMHQHFLGKVPNLVGQENFQLGRPCVRIL